MAHVGDGTRGAQPVVMHTQSAYDPIEERALILDAQPNDPLLYTMRLQWDAYLGALPTGGHHPARTMLATRDPAQFRGALAECMAAWFLSEKLKLRVVALAPGKRPDPDLVAYVENEPVFVEVKSLVVPPHASTRHVTERIVQRIDDAIPQLSGVAVVLLALRLPRSIDEERKTIASAVQSALTPQISAVLALEERIEVDASGFFRVDHHALVIHNTSATFAVPRSMFGTLRQIAVEGGQRRGSTGPSKGGDCIMPRAAMRKPPAVPRILGGAP